MKTVIDTVTLLFFTLGLLCTKYKFAYALRCYVCTRNVTTDLADNSVLRVSDVFNTEDCYNQELINCDRHAVFGDNKHVPKWTCQTYVQQWGAKYTVAKGCLQDAKWQSNGCTVKSEGVHVNTMCSCVTDACNGEPLSEQIKMYNQKFITDRHY